jgi:hypothetical protein
VTATPPQVPPPPQAQPPPQTPPPPQAPGALRTEPKGGVKQELQIADDADANEARLTGSAVIERAPGVDAEREQRGSRPAGPTVGQLAKQSETAASRGDCAAVRAIVGRIRKLDATFHKRHVEGNAAVKRCVK